MIGFWDAVASAGPYAKTVYTPCHSVITVPKKITGIGQILLKLSLEVGWYTFFLQPSVYMCLFTEVIFYSANKIPDNSDRCICQHICQKQT